MSMHSHPQRLLLLALSIAACGGGVTPAPAPPAPHLVPGGAVGDGAIDGHLAVYVTDDDTRVPVAGATVRVGASADPAPCSATSDSTGLVVFESASCPSLHGKQDVTASAAGYAPSTWIGVNGTNLTMSIRQIVRPAVDTATVTGTIDGWADVPAPAQGHQTLGVVGFSQTRDLGDRANTIAQGTRSVSVGIVGSTDVAANVCVRNALADDCNFRLTTRTGPQAHFAVVVDEDLHGTPNDSSDDTFTVINWALRTGLAFAAGDSASGESLPLIGDADMQSMVVSIGGPPAGLDALTAFPLLDLGDAGRIAMVLPALDTTHTATRVPKLEGALASAHYDLLAQAKDAADKDQPASTAWLHAIDPAGTVSLTAWLPPPGGLTATGGTYAFTAVPGATLAGAEIQTTAGDRAWSITIFDGSTSFTLPGLSPDPLPAGMAQLQVSALQIPGVDLASVAFDDAREKLTGIASDAIPFAR
jgi:hypothetical protein